LPDTTPGGRESRIVPGILPNVVDNGCIAFDRIAEREPVKDVARNLDRWVQGIVARTYSQGTIEELVQHDHKFKLAIKSEARVREALALEELL